MKRIRWAVLLLPWAAACSPFAIHQDYDHRFDFSKLKAYAWHLPPPGTPDVDTLMQQRIVRAVDDVLQLKGFKRAEGAAADFMVHAVASIHERIRTQPFTVGVGYTGPYGHAGAVQSVEVEIYEEGTVIVDFIAPDTKNMLWRGTARAAVDRSRSPEQREARIRDAVAAILEAFPPTSK